MLDKKYLPKVAIAFDTDFDKSSYEPDHLAIQKSLLRALPEHLFLNRHKDPLWKEFKKNFDALLPFFISFQENEKSLNLSFLVISKFRINTSKFVFEMISNWLIPCRRLNDVLFYAVDFSMPEVGDETYTLCKMVLKIKDLQELTAIKDNLPIFETEIRLGVQSAYYARRILEVKGLAASEKAAMIFEYIAYFVRRRPNAFGQDIFTEVQHLMVLCSDSFKNLRECRHLSRIIIVHYLFRKLIRKFVKNSPQKRHISIKIFQMLLKISSIPKKILGVLIGMNFLSNKEILEERHLLKSIQNYVPSAQGIEGSFFSSRRDPENTCTFYLEVEKKSGEAFTSEEIQKLRHELPIDLKGRIEHLMPLVFMPRNEEEVMRNILSLSDQIKFIRDIPQVFITFDEQTTSHLFFTVIIVRVLQKNTKSIQEIFENQGGFLEYIHDWKKDLGVIRKKYTKEATVFRVKLSKDMFLRLNHSIDLYKARQVVFSELTRLLGHLRDFNGGMISKQQELLDKVRHLLAEMSIHQDFLLENFFYSLRPPVMRTVLEPEALRTLFLMMLDALDQASVKADNTLIKIQRDLDVVYMMITTQEASLKLEVDKVLQQIISSSNDLAMAFVSVHDISCFGYIYSCDDSYTQEHFCQTVQGAIENFCNPSSIKDKR